MSLTVQILVKIMYSYYTRKGTTPFFLTEEEILSSNFCSFKERLINGGRSLCIFAEHSESSLRNARSDVPSFV